MRCPTFTAAVKELPEAPLPASRSVAFWARVTGACVHVLMYVCGHVCVWVLGMWV